MVRQGTISGVIGVAISGKEDLISKNKGIDGGSNVDSEAEGVMFSNHNSCYDIDQSYSGKEIQNEGVIVFDQKRRRVGSNPLIGPDSNVADILVDNIGLKSNKNEADQGLPVSLTEATWLPHSENPFITSDHPSLEGVQVHQLMVNGKREWDIDILDDLLNSRDKDLVQSIVLSDFLDNDSWYWHFEASGHYTVKSAYKALQHTQNTATGGANSGLWRKLWNLKIPAKVSNMLWRACRGSLPTRAKLQEKRVQVPLHCPFCQIAPETTLLLLVDCVFAQQCWSSAGQEIKEAAGLAFADWFTDMLQSFSFAVLGKIAMICWGIWRARNDLAWNNKEPVAAGVVSSTSAYFNQWLLANSRSQGAASAVSRGVEERWSVPEEDTIKINVDASVFTSANFFEYEQLSLLLKTR
ncbi:hypothetical protein G4B88_000409 [Cannabis sativa]|uniref:Reverse transcriptase zinc-binding domain-containing protein n=1 Tax=Cannabis sativa TaxID=3483 RepID=A0A7J6ERU7_CANSA|nr:hypothetical protein G4B88_000409 [Cannabis sativa]